MQFVELVRRAQQGDARAFGDLVQKYQGMAYGYAYVLLGDTHLAQDATQEAFLDAYQNLQSIQAPAAFPAWFRRVVFKHCDRFTRRKKLETVSLERAGAVADAAPSPDSQLMREETRRAALAALESLPPTERAVTILHDLRGYPQREVAAFLEIPLHTVKNRLRTARRKLSERMLALTQKVLNEDAPDIWQRMSDVKALIEASKEGNLEQVTNLLQQYPEMIADGPAWDLEHLYPEHPGWTPLFSAAMNGRIHIAKLVLDLGANPVPFEVSGGYHDDNFPSWINEIEQRGHGEIAALLRDAIAKRYGEPVDAANLHHSARDGDAERARQLIAEKPERVKQVDVIGCTALHWAVEHNHLPLVQLLVEKGAQIDARRGDGRTPALVAIFGMHRYWRREDKPEILQYLLDSGADYSLLVAACIGDVERVCTLLRQDPAQANAVDPIGRRPLSGAADIGHVEIARLLLEAGADPNARELICQGGWSLYSACTQGNYDVAALLLEYGANPSHWTDSMGNSIEQAIEQGHARIASLLYAYGGNCGIRMYSMYHRIDVVAEMLKMDPAQADQVMPHAWKGEHNEELAYNIMRLAIRYGARFENAGSWELRWTLVRYPKVFRLLQEHGADPNQPLLGIAGDMRRRYGDEETMVRHIRFLLEECGADINCHDQEGLTPLAGAARQGHAQLVEYLLANGAKTQTDGPDWTQPATLAEHNGHVKIASRLRQYAA